MSYKGKTTSVQHAMTDFQLYCFGCVCLPHTSWMGAAAATAAPRDREVRRSLVDSASHIYVVRFMPGPHSLLAPAWLRPATGSAACPCALSPQWSIRWEELEHLTFLAEGGFGKVYSATWRYCEVRCPSARPLSRQGFPEQAGCTHSTGSQRMDNKWLMHHHTSRDAGSLPHTCHLHVHAMTAACRCEPRKGAKPSLPPPPPTWG